MIYAFLLHMRKSAKKARFGALEARHCHQSYIVLELLPKSKNTFVGRERA
jgi:hypothetical protein